jgi:hypothetical protein
MSRQQILYGVMAGGCFALGACTTLPVTTDLNPNFSVANCHTYVFAKEHMANVDQPAAWGNPLNAERLRVSIEGHLLARGIQRASDPAAADCIVGYAMGTRQVFQSYYAGWGYGYGWGPGWGGPWGPGWGDWGYGGPWVSDETRIAVDVFDAKSHQPMWHGAVSQTVSGLTGPNAQSKIDAATFAIFSKFPVAAPTPVSAPHAPPAGAAPAPAGHSAT